MERTILIISGNPDVGEECIQELSLYGRRFRLPVARTLTQAAWLARESAPDVIFLDETAVDPERGENALEATAGLLTETAPVIVAAAPGKQAELSFLIKSGAVDFVERTSHFVSVAAVLLDRRVRLADRANGLVHFPDNEPATDFGEILRHEVNNPLTGILGNTELLLSRPDGLPPGAVERLRTIADLAVRLRETVRRLSNACDEHTEAAALRS